MEGPVGHEADAVVAHVELLEQAEAGEAGLLQPGQVVGREVAERQDKEGKKKKKERHCQRLVALSASSYSPEQKQKHL